MRSGNDNGRPGVPTQEADDVGDRVHVCVGAWCNNNCIFCMEIDREDRAARVASQTADDVKRMIDANRGVREILFTSGEPTMNKELPRYIGWAREAGYEVIGVISNGRMFSYEPYVRRLLAAGMNNVIVSIHGHDARLHDGLTRTKGSFDQTLAGLRCLSRLRAERGFSIQTSTVINRRNILFLGDICRLMQTLDADRHVFNVMMPDGRGLQLISQLMPRYLEVRDAFLALVPLLAPEFLARIAVLDVPYCATEGLPDSMRGYVERYFHYEPAGSFEERVAAMGLEPPVEGEGDLFQTSAIGGDLTAFSRVTRTFQEGYVKVKRAECAECRFDVLCRGAWRAYVEHFGWDEMVPVKTAPSGS